MTPQEKARKLRPLIVKSVASLDDKEASEAVELAPRMKYDGGLIRTGTRINWNGQLKRAAADLWDTAENSPDNSPDLWEDIDYIDGYRIIPKTITVGLAFALGEKGWWKASLYESKLAANVWTPEQHPDGWKLIER